MNIETNQVQELSKQHPEGLLDKKKRLTPTEYAQELRARGPIFFSETNQIWIVTEYELAREMLKNPSMSADRSAFFISLMPDLDISLIQDFFGVVGRMMVMSDAARHADRRKVATLGLNDNLVDRYRVIIEDTIDDLLAAVERKGTMDFVTDLAQPLPMAVLADLFQIPQEDRREFYRCANNMTQFFGGASQYRNQDGIEVNESAIRLRDYFQRLLADRKRKPRGDFLTIMAQSQEKFRLDDAEVISQAVMMLVAGGVTTTDQLCNNMYTLLSETGTVDLIRKDSGLLSSAIEECNRWDPGVSYLFRVAKSDLQIAGVSIEAGQTVFISNHAVNRDPAVFDSPERFNIQRSPNLHFAYGNGSHYCIGNRLARIQMDALFRNLIARYPRLRLDPVRPSQRLHYSLAFSGFSSIPVIFK